MEEQTQDNKQNEKKEVVLKIEGLYKKFSTNLRRSLFYGSVDLVRSALGKNYYNGALRKSEFWALKDINFELKHGEVLGIIGENGSGKSTLLRLLNGIFPPDRGTVTVRGRISALIAVGAGFHPHMTGRENIYLNGIILGMTMDELETKFQEIVNFADIGEFLDAPVSTYSSGMRVRLGFSIAIHSKPDILLVDEILSVGDLGFRNKSLRKIYELRKQSKGIIFISHNTEQVLNLCDKVILLHKGEILYIGDPKEAVIKYFEITAEHQMMLEDKEIKDQLGGGKFRTTHEVNVHNVTARGEGTTEDVTTGENLLVEFDLEVERAVERPRIVVVIRDPNVQKDVVWVENLYSQTSPPALSEGSYKYIVRMNNLNLAPGSYNIGVSVSDSVTNEVLFQVQKMGTFLVKSEGGKLLRGLLTVDSTWEVTKL